MSRIALGNLVKDVVTGIQGIATCISTELNGNRRITIQQPAKEDGSLPDAYDHDEVGVDYIDEGFASRVVPAAHTPVKLGEGLMGFRTLPAHMRVTLTTFLVSPSTGITSEIQIGNAKRMPDDFDDPEFVVKVDEHIAVMAGVMEVSDLRRMTAEEVDTYIAAQSDEALKSAKTGPDEDGGYWIEDV